MNLPPRWTRSLAMLGAATSLLAFASGLGAQAVSNPNLNAQLLVGARQGDLAQVERVLAAGAVPSSRNRLGKTALLLAAEGDDEEVVLLGEIAGQLVVLAVESPSG